MIKRRPSTRFETAHSCAQRWPRRTSTPSVFTAVVHSLQGQFTPDADLFHDAWHALRAALAKEMKRRGLWESPPSYLGAYGWERWDAETPDPRGPASSAGAHPGSAHGALAVPAAAARRGPGGAGDRGRCGSLLSPTRSI